MREITRIAGKGEGQDWRVSVRPAGYFYAPVGTIEVPSLALAALASLVILVPTAIGLMVGVSQVFVR